MVVENDANQEDELLPDPEVAPIEQSENELLPDPEATPDLGPVAPIGKVEGPKDGSGENRKPDSWQKEDAESLYVSFGEERPGQGHIGGEGGWTPVFDEEEDITPFDEPRLPEPEVEANYRTEAGDEPGSQPETASQTQKREHRSRLLQDRQVARTERRMTRQQKQSDHRQESVERAVERKTQRGQDVTDESRIGQAYAATHGGTQLSQARQEAQQQSQEQFDEQRYTAQMQSGGGMAGGGAGGVGGKDVTTVLQQILDAIKTLTEEVKKLAGIGTIGP